MRLPIIETLTRKIAPKTLPLSRYERKITEKNGVVEEGLFEHIDEVVQPKTRFFVEIGAGDGTNFSFARNLIENHGYGALLIEADKARASQLMDKYENSVSVRARRSFVSVENIVALFKSAQVPEEFAMLCIDIDGNDAHLWEAIGAHYRPDVVCVEYNASFGPDREFAIPYREDFCWTGDDFFGASFATFVKLGRTLGYRLVHCTSNGDNLFFVRADLADRFPGIPNDPRDLYQLPQYGRNGRAPNGKGHPASAQNASVGERAFFKARYRLLALPRRVVAALERSRLRGIRDAHARASEGPRA